MIGLPPGLEARPVEYHHWTEQGVYHAFSWRPPDGAHLIKLEVAGEWAYAEFADGGGPLLWESVRRIFGLDDADRVGWSEVIAMALGREII